MDDELTALLAAARLEHRAKCLRDEELTAKHLHDMRTSATLQPNMRELGLLEIEIESLSAALATSQPSPACTACGLSPTAPSTRLYVFKRTTSVSQFEARVQALQDEFEARVQALQDEYFADDLQPPDTAHAWSEARLRAFFESGGEISVETASEGDTSDERVCGMACGIACRTAGQMANSSPSECITPDASAAVSDGGRSSWSARRTCGRSWRPLSSSASPIIGSLPLRWQSYEADYE